MSACPKCNMPNPPASPPHANVCPRWQCSVCSAMFSTFPEPLTKRFGLSPVCAPCRYAQLTSPPVAVTQIAPSAVAPA